MDASEVFSDCASEVFSDCSQNPPPEKTRCVRGNFEHPRDVSDISGATGRRSLHVEHQVASALLRVSRAAEPERANQRERHRDGGYYEIGD